MAEKLECVVIGAGVVGLAVARALALRGREVWVLEAAPGIGTGTSSRNSEVIHAGIYYPPGSLKARLCVAGRSALYAYCEERSVAHRRCGKLIVATNEAQRGQLGRIQAAAAANGVHDLRLLSADEVQQMEPSLRCVAALHSPGTGIIDSHALMLSFQGDIEREGGNVVLNTAVAQWERAQAAIKIVASDGTEIEAGMVVNAAGLHAPRLAGCLKGLDAASVPRARFCKGNYFSLAGRSPFSRLIYPVPEEAGLGVHLTLDLGGQARFGPDVEWVDDPEALQVDPARADGFYAEIRKYWPELQDRSLLPAYAGIRPKTSGPGEPAADFIVQGPLQHGVPGLINLFGIESPGLTSSLAIGDLVASLLTQ
jgi:L-2-hydroxyglutarate oxidase LhgO